MRSFYLACALSLESKAYFGSSANVVFNGCAAKNFCARFQVRHMTNRKQIINTLSDHVCVSLVCFHSIPYRNIGKNVCELNERIVAKFIERQAENYDKRAQNTKRKLYRTQTDEKTTHRAEIGLQTACGLMNFIISVFFLCVDVKNHRAPLLKLA